MALSVGFSTSSGIATTVRAPNQVIIGTLSAPVACVEEIAHQLKITQCEKNGILIIYAGDLYGGDLEIVKDPGILAINPMKLILVGAHIADSDEEDSLAQLMIQSDWCIDLYSRRDAGLEVTEVSSVQEAVMKTAERDIFTQKPLRMVYSIKT